MTEKAKKYFDSIKKEQKQTQLLMSLLPTLHVKESEPDTSTVLVYHTSISHFFLKTVSFDGVMVCRAQKEYAKAHLIFGVV